jgi:hypothetical protein
MTNAAVNSQPAGTLPQLRSGPLIVGGVLVGIGAMAGLVGLATAGWRAVSATQQWIKEMEIPPGQLAKLKWEQARTAAASGASAWRVHPNAQARLSRR